MRLSIRHTTQYHYQAPQAYTLQRLRLTPRQHAAQQLLFWEIDIEGAKKELHYRDHYNNETWLVSAMGEPHQINISAHGMIETSETHGVTDEQVPAPDWLFLRQGALTEPDEALAELAAAFEDAGDRLEALHELMETLNRQMKFQPGATATTTSAMEAWKARSGVCQDYAHVFCSVARMAGVPTRYVGGYLMMNDRIEQSAAHAWVEAKVDGLGWVGFDAANGISPDERYVRVALGLDFRDASPTSGIRHGSGDEQLNVELHVEQQ